jgi:peptide-methionine (R)-S-oxide reductase
MNRRAFLALCAAPLALAACGGDRAAASGARAAGDPPDWRALLSPEAYRVLFEDGTERPFSSPLNDEHRDGTYVCAACFNPLFRSEDKFDSGTGWPSFTRAIPESYGTRLDWSLGIPRGEYHCARCGGHQGHVFEDGPPPTGERWCNNGVALRFIPAGEPLPPLRL